VPETCLPLALVLVSVAPNVLSKAIWFVIAPLANIGVSGESLPDAVAILVALSPLALIVLTRCPHVLALSVDLSLAVLPLVDISVRKALEADAVSFVLHPVALVYPGRVVSDDAKALPHRVYDLSPVDRILITFYSELL
jgi:hypothetical protein